MNRSSNRKGRKSANRVRKDSRGGGPHNLALTNKIHTLEEVGAAIEMIGKMRGHADRSSLLKESPLPDQLVEVETQLDEYEDHLQEWEEKEGLARREKEGLARREKADAEEAERIAQEDDEEIDYASSSTPARRVDDQWSQPERYEFDRFGY